MTTNADGCGLGWYAERLEPGVFRDVLPAWNDQNLISLARQVKTPLFFAHERAATFGPIQRSNCHPFAFGNKLFMHNGQIGGFESIRREVEGLVWCNSITLGWAPPIARGSTSCCWAMD